MFFIERRRDDGEGDGDEGEDETIVDGVREAFAGDLQDLRRRAARRRGRPRRPGPARPGRPRSRARAGLQRVDEPVWGLRRGVIVQLVRVALGDDGADHRGAHRRAQGADELRGRGRDAEHPLLDGALHGEGGGRHDRAEPEARDPEVEGDRCLGGVNVSVVSR